MTNPCVIETFRLNKSYGEYKAVRDLNLSVPAGGITAFLGKNGAGKSTTIKMLLGMISPTSGEGTLLGTRISELESRRHNLRRVAYVAENMALYRYMSVEQVMRFARSFYPDWREDLAAAFYAALLLSGGLIYFGLSVLIASLIEGEFTAPAVAYGLTVLSIVTFANVDRIRPYADIWRYMSGDNQLNKATYLLVGPFPWTSLMASLTVAGALLAVSVVVIQRKEF